MLFCALWDCSREARGENRAFLATEKKSRQWAVLRVLLIDGTFWDGSQMTPFHSKLRTEETNTETLYCCSFKILTN